MYLTILIGTTPPFTVNLEEFGLKQVTFGRSSNCDIVLDSRIVSAYHGCFIRNPDGWIIQDGYSTNGLFVNEEPIRERELTDGLKIYVGSEKHPERVIMLCSSVNQDSLYCRFPLGSRSRIRIGRREDCEIRLDYVGASQIHAELDRSPDGKWYIRAAPGCEVRLNGMPVQQAARQLPELGRFLIGNTQFLYRRDELIYYTLKNGLGLEALHVTKTVSAGKSKKTIVDDVSFRILPGEFVAIVGGSGAGKSSLMKCISGLSGCTGGQVLLQGEDMKKGFGSLKKLIGYVPQTDIVYDSLTLERMLYYSAKLRMPPDTTKADLRKRIFEVLAMVELAGFEKILIRNLSGGQKKRASIAVELLSDPGIFFLDEPTSGLDPGTEQNLMHTLRRMTEQGKTIILVTHTPLNLGLCDKIVFMGAGGRLCFCGSPQESLQFFGVKNLVDIYNLVWTDSKEWARKYAAFRPMLPSIPEAGGKPEKKKRPSALRQWAILSARNLEMLANDRRRLFLQTVMAPVLGIMLCAAFGSGTQPFKYWGDTEKFSIAMACCFFWMGMFQAIQEISRERSIVEREKMADLRSGAYLFSKITLLGGILLPQCAVLLGIVWGLIGHPEKGVLFVNLPFLEFFLIAWLTALSAAALGLCVSAAVKTTEQAVTASPFLLIPQILFSQVLCEMTDGIGWAFTQIVSCNWACLAFCSSAGINDLPEKTTEAVLGGWHTTEASTKMRYWTSLTPAWSFGNPVPQSLLVLAGLSVLFFALAYLAVRRRKE